MSTTNQFDPITYLDRHRQDVLDDEHGGGEGRGLERRVGVVGGIECLDQRLGDHFWGGWFSPVGVCVWWGDGVSVRRGQANSTPISLVDKTLQRIFNQIAGGGPCARLRIAELIHTRTPKTNPNPTD